jgi:hypothetical protein
MGTMELYFTHKTQTTTAYQNINITTSTLEGKNLIKIMIKIYQPIHQK